MNIFELMEDIGNNIKYEIDKRGVSQNQLAKEINVNKSTVSKYISGECLPPVDKLINICCALGCEIEDLIILDGEEII